jgi:N-acetylglucosaminyldiphosphoundecaprenol N-acetyl-beta-D-mannosaminyltransferase
VLTSTSQQRVAAFWRSCTEPGRLVATLDDVLSSPWRTQPVRVQTVNLQHVHLIATSPEATEAALAADLISADGWPVAFLARRMKLRCERITGRQIVDALLHDPALTGTRVALIGSRADTAETFGALLRRNGVTLTFGWHGDASACDPAALADQVRAQGCDVVLVALGAPRGEPLAQALTELLPRGLLVGVGGAVEMSTDDMPAAPDWMGRVGVEWCYRLVREPRRLGHRYLVESPRALFSLALVVARTWL